MSSQEIQLLTEIKAQLQEVNNTLRDLKGDLQTDRTWVWRILALTILGAFALIGVKLAFP